MPSCVKMIPPGMRKVLSIARAHMPLDTALGSAASGALGDVSP